MDSKKKNTTGWVLCPSKGFPGKFYYFNMVTGQAVWSSNLCDALKRDPSINQISGSHDYPEPDTNPEYCPSVSSLSSFKKLETPVQQSRIAMRPSFGQTIFPDYIQPDNNINNMMQMTWVPFMPMWNFLPRQPSWEPIFAKDSIPIKVPNAKYPSVKRKVCSTETQTERTRVPCQVLKKSKLSNFESTKQSNKSCDNLNLLSNDIPYSKVFEKPASTSNKVVGSHRKVILSSLSDESICEKMGTLSTWNRVQNPTNKMYRNQLLKEKSVLTETFGLKSTSKEVLVNARKCNPFSDLIYSNKVQIPNERMKDGVNNNSLKQKLKMPVVNKNATDKETLCQGDTVDNFDKSDLRFLLMAKKRRSCESMKPDYDEKQKTNMMTALTNKKVTFDIEEYEDISDDSLTSECKDPVNNLGVLAKPTMNTDAWYIIVDIDILLGDLLFIQSLMKADPKCCMYIPSYIHIEIIKMTTNMALSRDTIMAARQLKRWISSQNEVIDVQPDNAEMNAFTMEESIIDSCLELLSLNYHVVIITKDSDFKLKANSLGLIAHTIEEVKLNAKNKQKVIFDIKKIKRTIHNDRSIRKNLLDTGTSQTDKKKQNEFLFQNVLKARTQENEFLFQKGLNADKNEVFLKSFRTDQKEFQLQNSSRTEQNMFLFQNSSTPNPKEFHFENGPKPFFRNENESNNQRVLTEAELFNKGHSNEAMAEHYTAEQEMTFELKGIEDRIKTRMEEYLCSFTQIMEDCLSELLWNCNNVLIQPPWSLHEASQCIKRVYGQDESVKLYSESLIMMLFYNCDKFGKPKMNITPYAFTQMFVCGYSLITSLKPIVSKKHIIQETEVSLRDLHHKIQNVATDSEFEFERIAISNIGIDSETECNKRNYVKCRGEIIEYLKNHFKDWKSFIGEPGGTKKQNFDVKIVRTIGKDIKSLKMDRNKNMTLENANENQIESTKNNQKPKILENIVKDKTIVVKHFKPIADFEDRLKKNLTYKNDRSKRHSNDDDLGNVSLMAKQIESNLIGVADKAVESEFLTVDDTTNDSGFETDSYAPFKMFLTELSGAFKLLHRFIKKFMKDQRKKEFDKDEQDSLKRKIKQYNNIILNIIKQLHRIIVREGPSNDGPSLRAYLLKTGDISTEDYRITKYRQVIIKCLEQAQILEKALQLMLSILEGSEVNQTSSTDAIQYYNIFQ